MKNSMTWLVLSNSKDAPSFDELKAMYLRLGGKKDTTKLSKCQLAHLVDYLIIINDNKEDFLKLANDILGEEKCERVYDEWWLHCEYKVWKIKAVVDVDWWQYNCIVYEWTEYPRYLYEDVSWSFEWAMEWLKEMRDQLENEIEWTQLDQTINHWDDWEEVIEQWQWKYKWYTFKLWTRTYKEIVDDEIPYTEWEDECWCVETNELVWKDEGHYDDHIRDYVEQELSKSKAVKINALHMKLCVLYNTVLSYLYGHWIVSRKLRMKYVLDCNTWKRCNSKEYLKEYWWD